MLENSNQWEKEQENEGMCEGIVSQVSEFLQHHSGNMFAMHFRGEL